MLLQNMKIIQVLPKLGISRLLLYLFSFSLVEEQEIEKMRRRLSEKEGCQKSDIDLRIIKENIDIFTEFLTSSMEEKR